MYNCILVEDFGKISYYVDGIIYVRSIKSRKDNFYIFYKASTKRDLDETFCLFLENNPKVEITCFNTTNQQSTGWYLSALCRGKISDRVVVGEL